MLAWWISLWAFAAAGGVVFGYVLCARNVPASIAKMTDDERSQLAAKVADERGKK